MSFIGDINLKDDYFLVLIFEGIFDEPVPKLHNLDESTSSLTDLIVDQVLKETAAADASGMVNCLSNIGISNYQKLVLVIALPFRDPLLNANKLSKV